MTGRGALGVLLARVNARVDDQIDVVKRLGVYAASRGGSLAVLEAPAEVRTQLEPVTRSPEAMAISRAVKARFDAHGRSPSGARHVVVIPGSAFQAPGAFGLQALIC